jgi:HEAT repeat protein
LSIDIDARRQPALDALSAFSNIVIVGAPGAGKSHLVRVYSAQIARRALQTFRESKRPPQGALKHAIPLLLPMREYAGSLKAMIAERIPRSVPLEKLLASGVVTIICDAVNEVPRNLVETKVLADDLSAFTTNFPRCRYVITTRLMAYLPTLPFPVFELEPLRQADLSDCLTQAGLSLDALPVQLKGTLDNPLLLTLYLELAASNRRNISNPSTLLAATIEIMGKRLHAVRKIHVDLRTLVSQAAFDLVGRGRLSMTLEETEAHLASALTQSKQSREVVDVNALISIGLLTVDAEGQIGFFHQTALEYLAAVELLRRYEQDPGELTTLINFHRWDETIALFVSLLDRDTRTKVLTELARVDIGFACHAFESATIKQEDTALFLFDLIAKKLAAPTLSASEKLDLSRAAKMLAPYGRSEALVKWLDDDLMAHDAALHLAIKKDKAIVPRLVDLLMKDNVWPSDFARALDLLADETVVHALIAHGETASSESLADSNIADVLQRFESEALYQETDRLLRSPEAHKRAFAAEILSRLNSPRANATLAELLSDRSHDVRWRALFALRGGWRREGYKTADLVAKVFKLLSDRVSGSDAASYLIEHADSEILDEAQRRLSLARGKTQQINLCAVLARKHPDKVRDLLFEKLRNYRPFYHKPLCHALANLPVDKVLPEVLTFLRIDDSRLRNTVIEALSWLRIRSEELPISKEDCSFLFSLWEKQPQLYHRAAYLLAENFRAVSKPLWLKRLNNPTYTGRTMLVEWVSRMPLAKADLKPEVIEWLITNLDTKSQYGGWSPVANIVGQVLDESAVHEKLIPLLSSSNPTVRANAYTAVKTAERTLGKRLSKVPEDQEQSAGE